MPSTPSLNLSESVKAFSGAWQSTHANVLSKDKIGSKNNFFPKAMPSTVCGLSIGITGANMLSSNTFGISRELGVAK